MDEEILRKLDKRLADGDISEDTYKKIKARYEKKETIDQDEFDDEEEIETDEETIDTKGKAKKVSLSGASKASDINCQSFSSSGASKVEGYLKADTARISGATKVEGDAFLGELVSSGSFKVEGNTEADEMELSGASKFEGNVKTKKIKSKGSSKFEGDVEADEFSSFGALKMESSVTAKTFTASGAFKIEDTLKADEIMLKPGGDCSINHIKGGDILVESGGSGIFSMFKKGTLKSKDINGDKIYLENTRAEIVEGDEVKIGPGCKIDKVKAKNLKVHESSSVGSKQELN
ncbi:MAG: polymer-forming cytoskeletal protein [Candidatus Saliniplasma sp.]